MELSTSFDARFEASCQRREFCFQGCDLLVANCWWRPSICNRKRVVLLFGPGFVGLTHFDPVLAVSLYALTSNNSITCTQALDCYLWRKILTDGGRA
jgi:hypothetical protein